MNWPLFWTIWCGGWAVFWWVDLAVSLSRGPVSNKALEDRRAAGRAIGFLLAALATILALAIHFAS